MIFRFGLTMAGGSVEMVIFGPGFLGVIVTFLVVRNDR